MVDEVDGRKKAHLFLPPTIKWVYRRPSTHKRPSTGALKASVFYSGHDKMLLTMVPESMNQAIVVWKATEDCHSLWHMRMTVIISSA